MTVVRSARILEGIGRIDPRSHSRLEKDMQSLLAAELLEDRRRDLVAAAEHDRQVVRIARARRAERRARRATERAARATRQAAHARIAIG